MLETDDEAEEEEEEEEERVEERETSIQSDAGRVGFSSRNS